MPRYFFHLDAERRYVDTDGLELADLGAAEREALRIISELITGDALGDIWSVDEWVMTVSDETARELFSIRLITYRRPGAGSD
jgi:hypothetical protein